MIVATTIPFALAFAVGIMVLRGESANLLSVGAIDFGLVVDATVIMVENIFRHLSQPPRERFQRGGGRDRHGGIQSFFGKLGTIELSATEVNRAIFFAAAANLRSGCVIWRLKRNPITSANIANARQINHV